MSAVKMQILATPLLLVWLVLMIFMYRGLIRAFGFPDQFSASGLPEFAFWLFFGVWITVYVVLSIDAYRRLGYVLLKLDNAREKTSFNDVASFDFRAANKLASESISVQDPILRPLTSGLHKPLNEIR